MNIAVIIHELLKEGGGERQCLCLARALSRLGHSVTVYASAYDPYNCFSEICQELTIIEMGRGRLSSIRRPTFLRAYLDMRKLAKSVRALHDIWNPHHWPGQWAAVWLKKKSGGAVAWTCNDVPNFHELAVRRQSIADYLKSPIYWFNYLFDRAQNRKVDLAMFLSEWAQSEYRAIYPGKTCVVRSGTDPQRFRPGGDREKVRERFGYRADDFVLLWLGIFMPHRRLEDAIAAVGKLSDRGTSVKLLLAGSQGLAPEYSRSLTDLVDRLGLQARVTFAGKVDDDELRDFYCAADAFVFPNETQTWGLVVLEAMACGCPVLVSKGAAIHEVLTDKENALLFPARQPSELAERVQMLVDSPELRARNAKKAMELVRTQYNWEAFAGRVAEVLKEIVAEGWQLRA